MAIDEVFPNPTVKQVIFQIRYPNLFFLESKIGELQMRIMEIFPDSALIFKRQLFITEVGPEVTADQIQEKLPQEQGQKFWQFSSPKGYTLSVHTNSLDITSNFHKTYNNPTSADRFRDVIETTISAFLSITNLPQIKRIGLRYIDECVFDEKTSKSFLDHFNSCLNTSRFPIENSIDNHYKATVKKGIYFMRFMETYESQLQTPVLKLDFDGFANDIRSDSYLSTTDDLHRLISDEYESSIKEPVISKMRMEEKI